MPAPLKPTFGGRKRDLVGQTFGRLHVLSITDKTTIKKGVVYLCRCECGNPDSVEASTTALLHGEKKSCGCLKGRRVTADHLNRECREAVLLAIYWAESLGFEMVVYFSNGSANYTVHPHSAELSYQVGYRVTPQGQVTHSRGFPNYPTLFGEKSERVYLQFRRRGQEPPEAWTTYTSSHIFYAHQRHLAEEAVAQLDEEQPNMEHRIKPNEEE